MKNSIYSNKHNNLLDKIVVKKRYEMLILVFEKIKINDLKNMIIQAMEKNDASEFLDHLSEVMPGIRLKNKL